MNIEAGSSWRTGVRWSAAAFIVFVAHVAGAWIIAQREPEASLGEAVSAIMVELAPLPVAPAMEALSVPPAPEIREVQPEPMAEMPEPEFDLPPPPEPAEPTFDAAEIEPPPPAPEPEVVLPKPSKRPPVREPPKPEVKKNPVQRSRQERGQAKPQNKVTTAPPHSQTAVSPAAPALKSTSLSSSSPANWKGALLAHLNRAKRYPFEARQRREEGTVRLSFSIDRSGRVVSYRIVGSSGSTALDQEALAMIRRASPLPAPPPKVGGAHINLTVPVRFNIN